MSSGESKCPWYQVFGHPPEEMGHLHSKCVKSQPTSPFNGSTRFSSLSHHRQIQTPSGGGRRGALHRKHSQSQDLPGSSGLTLRVAETCCSIKRKNTKPLTEGKLLSFVEQFCSLNYNQDRQLLFIWFLSEQLVLLRGGSKGITFWSWRRTQTN